MAALCLLFFWWLYFICLNLRSFLAAYAAFDVTPDFLLDSSVIQYSDQGTNKHTVEEAVMMHWTSYIMDLEVSGWLVIV